MFENADGRTTVRRRSHWYTNSSPGAFGSGELIKQRITLVENQGHLCQNTFIFDKNIYFSQPEFCMELKFLNNIERG